MIVLDTTVLVYALGRDHPLAEPCRRLVEAIGEGRVTATTTVEVIQEFVHVRARRGTRGEAVQLARAYADLLSPLIGVGEEDLASGLRLFEEHKGLGAFDAILAATAAARERSTLVSADTAFGNIPGFRHIHPATAELESLWASR